MDTAKHAKCNRKPQLILVGFELDQAETNNTLEFEAGWFCLLLP